MTTHFAGCHGFLVEPESIGETLGWTSVPPPQQCRVSELHEASVTKRELIWRSTWPGNDSRPSMWEEAWRDDEDALLFITGHRPTIRIFGDGSEIEIAPSAEGRMAHALASTALTTLAHLSGRLVIHAAAAGDAAGVTLICGESGSGKSSLLLALAGAGWKTFSDDLCVLHPEGKSFLLWPGPSWIRLGSGAKPSLEPKFQMEWKNAYSDDEWHSRVPAPVTRLVFMDKPGGTEVVWEKIEREAAISLISRDALWQLEPERRGEELFPLAVSLASAAPSFRLRLPKADDWVGQAVRVLTAP